jgi:hypothetical protein
LIPRSLGPVSLALCLAACASGTGVNPRLDDGALRDGGPAIADRDRDGVEDALDCGPDDALVGRRSEEACASACATGVRACVDGVFAACSAPTECTCTTGNTRIVDCPRCGTQEQRCEGDAWVDVGGCRSMALCAPGEREMQASDECGLGGQRARECTESCVFGEWSCVSGTRVGLWVLPTGATRWLRYPLDPDGSPFAPMEPVEAAFEVEERGEAFILTRTRYHVLRVSDRQWVRSGRRTDLFPEAGSDEVLDAYGVPTRLSGAMRPDATLLTRTRVLVYPNLDAAAGTSDRPIVQDCCATQWPGALAPRAADVRGIFFDPDNAERWPTTTHATCTTPPSGFYGAVIAAPGRVHIQDPGCSFDFVASLPFASFPPFALPGAPRFEDVRAVFFLSGLFVVGDP